jgi:hypothetical protein
MFQAPVISTKGAPNRTDIPVSLPPSAMSHIGQLVLPGFGGQFKKIRLTASRSHPG